MCSLKCGDTNLIFLPPPHPLPPNNFSDDEMRNLNIGCLQDEGVIFVWVTGGWVEARQAGGLGG